MSEIFKSFEKQENLLIKLPEREKEFKIDFSNLNKSIVKDIGKNNDLNLYKNDRGLNKTEKRSIKKEGFKSNDIINSIGSIKEYEIYKNANLKEVNILGADCLIRNDINWVQKDSMGRTNKERADNGLSPINNDNKIIELHHIGQRQNSPFAELTTDEHRGKGNDTVLHDKNKETEIDRNDFAKERSEYWKSRANDCEGRA
jgi:hypothetical protein